MKMVNQEVLNDTAKLIMHRLIARALTRDPALVLQARVELANLAQRFPDRSFVVEWKGFSASRWISSGLFSRDGTINT